MFGVRRKDREVTSREWMESVLRKALILEMAMVDDGEAYVLPLNYGYWSNCLYVHGAMAGRKVDVLKKNPRVAFNVVDGVRIVPRPRKPGKIWCIYRSVCGTGTARFVSELAEKRRAIAVMKEHYGDADRSYMTKDAALEKIVNVFAMEIDEMTGKTKGYPNPDNPNAPLWNAE